MDYNANINHWLPSSFFCSLCTLAKSRHEKTIWQQLFFSFFFFYGNFLLLFSFQTSLLLLRVLASVFGNILCCFRSVSQSKHSFIFIWNWVGERREVRLVARYDRERRGPSHTNVGVWKRAEPGQGGTKSGVELSQECTFTYLAIHCTREYLSHL